MPRCVSTKDLWALRSQPRTLQITDLDAVLSLFKTSLRTSNQHLTSATLYALPSLLPLIVARNASTNSNGPLSSSSSSGIDMYALRQVFGAFLTPGGIVDRLGDKERLQAKARESLVLIGGYAYRAGSSSTFLSKSTKGGETPLAAFERVVKETGLASKVWKVREQVSRASHHLRHLSSPCDSRS